MRRRERKMRERRENCSNQDKCKLIARLYIFKLLAKNTTFSEKNDFLIMNFQPFTWMTNYTPYVIH